jgi:hypothetical protein
MCPTRRKRASTPGTTGNAVPYGRGVRSGITASASVAV